jgi:phosphocarrier protein
MEIKKEIVVKNKTGLHARPAAIFVQIANKYDSDITIIKDDQEVNGKSIMGILMLAAEKGSRITIVADGEDAEKAVEELSKILLHDIESDVVG